MDCTVICDCKIAKHEHGTRNMYVIHKCRGAACRDANAVSERDRTRQKAYGRSPYTSADQAREHVQRLQAAGMGIKHIGKAAGVPGSSISRLIYGRTERNEGPAKKILKTNAEKILAVRPTLHVMANAQRINGAGTVRRLRALIAIGWSGRELADRLEWQQNNLHRIINGDRGLKVEVHTAKLVRALYNELWDQAPPATTGRERATVIRAKRLAFRNGWHKPMDWDDDQIDNPEYTPVLVLEKGSKVEANREAFLKEVEFFADAGEQIAGIARALGVSQDAVEKRLERYERLDLLKRIGYATKAKAA
ncbi:hypothetical protein [Glutamicibacter ardleyensis]|uniref:hypothetical protein n=1 Tax=Glutamicibacter ardleyensis TaxID=225894 RepID=UPI003FCEFDF6